MKDAKNERFEEWFVLEGTDRIPDEVVGKPWQDQAIRDTQEVLKVLRLLFYLLTVFLVIFVVHSLALLVFRTS